MYGSSHICIKIDVLGHKHKKPGIKKRNWFLLQSHTMEHPCYMQKPCDKFIKEHHHAHKKYKDFLLKSCLKNHELKDNGNADQHISTPITL